MNNDTVETCFWNYYNIAKWKKYPDKYNNFRKKEEDKARNSVDIYEDLNIGDMITSEKVISVLSHGLELQMLTGQLM